MLNLPCGLNLRQYYTLSGAYENTAMICSLLASCKESKVNPREWLIDIIAKMPYYQKPSAKNNLNELLPHKWNKNESGKI